MIFGKDLIIILLKINQNKHMNNLKTLIIYHYEDNDGLFSQAIATYYLNTTLKWFDIDYLPADYITLSKITKEKIDEWNNTYNAVILTDVSFNDTKIFSYFIDTLGTKLTWIDHHAPIIKWANSTGRDNVNGIRDTKHSALYNMFNYSYNPLLINDNMPELFKILSAYDSFTFKEAGYDKNYVTKINKAVEACTELNREKTLEIVKNAIENKNMKIDNFIQDGETIFNYDIYQYKKMCEHCNKQWIVENELAAVLFYDNSSSSLMFDSIKKINPNIKRGIVFHHKENDLWSMSLYNIYDNDDFNCGTYLKEHYNGGGHVGAAGCTLTNKQFIKIINDEEI